jgi:uncharacterized integral membrane protein
MSRIMTDVAPQQERRIRRNQTARLFAAAVLVAVFAAFAIDNRQQTDVGWVFGDHQAPLWIVLIGAGVVGALVGRLLQWRRMHHHNDYSCGPTGALLPTVPCGPTGALLPGWEWACAGAPNANWAAASAPTTASSAPQRRTREDTCPAHSIGRVAMVLSMSAASR